MFLLVKITFQTKPKQYYPNSITQIQYYWTFSNTISPFYYNHTICSSACSSIFFEFFLNFFWIFFEFFLKTGREVLQIAKRGKYAIGDVINTHKAWSEKFYVVAAGVVEARILKEDEEEGTNGEHRGSIGK